MALLDEREGRGAPGLGGIRDSIADHLILEPARLNAPPVLALRPRIMRMLEGAACP